MAISSAQRRGRSFSVVLMFGSLDCRCAFVAQQSVIHRVLYCLCTLAVVLMFHCLCAQWAICNNLTLKEVPTLQTIDQLGTLSLMFSVTQKDCNFQHFAERFREVKLQRWPCQGALRVSSI